MKQDGHSQAKVLNPEELECLFSCFQSGCDRALFGICLYTGCRISEACSLLSEDVYARPGEVLPVLRIRRCNTKGKTESRQIPIHPCLRDYLMAHAPVRKFVFPRRHCHLKLLNPISADAILRAALQQAGLVGVSTHSFRRTALTQLSATGVPLRVIQEISGHRSLPVLQKYLEVGPGQVENTISQLAW